MKIKIELEQGWETAKEVSVYFWLLSRTFEQLAKMEVDAPKDWFLDILGKSPETYKVNLTHL